jgi:hypothetical protein
MNDSEILQTLRFDTKNIPGALIDEVAPSLRHKTTTKHNLSVIKRTCKAVKIISESHPACGGFGLFAQRKLRESEWIIDYHGFVTMNGDECKESDYTYSFAKRRLVIDGVFGGYGGYANDYRNISSKANAEFYEYVDSTGDLKCAIRVKKGRCIAKKEEILINYGKSFWKSRVGNDLGQFLNRI